MSNKTQKLLILNLPYFIAILVEGRATGLYRRDAV